MQVFQFLLLIVTNLIRYVGNAFLNSRLKTHKRSSSKQRRVSKLKRSCVCSQSYINWSFQFGSMEMLIMSDVVWKLSDIRFFCKRTENLNRKIVILRTYCSQFSHNQITCYHPHCTSYTKLIIYIFIIPFIVFFSLFIIISIPVFSVLNPS